MRFSIIISLFLALTATAQETAPTVGIHLFSLCGKFDAQAHALTTPAGEAIKLLGKNLPAEARELCAQGLNLRKAAGGWEFEPVRIRPCPEKLKYPVLLCAEFQGKEFVTYWHDTVVRILGPSPPQKDQANPADWCLDGKKMPVKDERGWTFEEENYRPFRGMQRSGFSVGNQ